MRVRELYSPLSGRHSQGQTVEFRAVSEEKTPQKLNVKSISLKDWERRFWNNLPCFFPVWSHDHSNPFLFRLKRGRRSRVKSSSDLTNNPATEPPLPVGLKSDINADINLEPRFSGCRTRHSFVVQFWT